MYVINVEATIWMDKSGLYSDRRRCFCATYLIEDGFESIEQAKAAVKEVKLDPKNFVYLSFMAQ